MALVACNTGIVGLELASGTCDDRNMLVFAILSRLLHLLLFYNICLLICFYCHLMPFYNCIENDRRFFVLF